MLHRFFRKSIATATSTHFLFLAAFAQGSSFSDALEKTISRASQKQHKRMINSTEVDIKGGSNGVMIVESKDARISLESGQVLRHIFLESEIFQVFWDGVLNEKFQYLRIDHCRFFVLFNEIDNNIYAYDYRGYRYLVSAIDLNSEEAETQIETQSSFSF